jgi:hypothetical protein
MSQYYHLIDFNQISNFIIKIVIIYFIKIIYFIINHHLLIIIIIYPINLVHFKFKFNH